MRPLRLAPALLAALAVAALGASGCLTRVPRQKLAAPEPIALAFVADPDHGGSAVAAPAALVAAVKGELGEHNLSLTEVPLDALGGRRLSDARLDAVRAHAAGKAGWVGLLEVRARYFSQLEGRYRWEVQTRVALGRAGGTPVQDAFSVPVVLTFEHEREADAIAQAAPDIALRLGALVDGLVEAGPPASPPKSQAGQGTSPAAAAAPTVRAKPLPGPRTPPRAIYFVMVDRFANGDPANDGDADPADPQAFHGGDVRGLLGKLDWLQALGVDTVWLSPVFSMRTAKWHGYGAFHGYWTWRLDALEPRLTDEAALVALSDELHRRGMKLVLDLVLNHVGPDAPLLKEHPEWFHHRGGIKDWNDPVALVEGDVHGLTDFAQEQPEANAWLVGSTRRWLRAGPA